jgi:hypothetical protein
MLRRAWHRIEAVLIALEYTGAGAPAAEAQQATARLERRLADLENRIISLEATQRATGPAPLG